MGKMDIKKKLTWLQNLKIITLIGYALIGVWVYESGKTIYGALGLLPFTAMGIACCVLYATLTKEEKRNIHETAGDSITLHLNPYYMLVLLASTNLFFWWSAFNH